MAQINKKTLDIILEDNADFRYRLDFTEKTLQCSPHPLTGEDTNCIEITSVIDVSGSTLEGTLASSFTDDAVHLGDFSFSTETAAQGVVYMSMDKTLIDIASSNSPLVSGSLLDRHRHIGVYDVTLLDGTTGETTRIMEGNVFVSAGVTEGASIPGSVVDAVSAARDAADLAEASAVLASTNATESVQASEEATISAETASSAATTAVQSAQSAVQSAQSAVQSAQSAERSAELVTEAGVYTLRYLGASDIPPTSRVDGASVVHGDYYLEDTSSGMKYYNATSGEWVDRDPTESSATGGGYVGKIKFLALESLSDTLVGALAANDADRNATLEMAARNQLKIEQAMNQKDADGNEIPMSQRGHGFKIELGFGYIPIIGNLVLDPVACDFLGQGAFRRRKYLSFNGSAIHDSIEEYPTCLMPVGDDTDGIRTQCSSSNVGNFSVHGGLKGEGATGHGMVFGYNPYFEEYLASADEGLRLAGLPNTFTQDRFSKPLVFEDITNFSTVGVDTEIIVPVKGSFNDPREILLDDTIDIPLVRWVRAFDDQGTELARFANVGGKLGGGIVGISDKNRQCTSKPIDGETRVYHKSIADDDTTTTVVVPGGLPAETATIEVSLYNLVKHASHTMLVTPFISGSYSIAARSQLNQYKNIMCVGMPWNGVMLVDGAYNNFTNVSARYNTLDGFYAPAGYEDFMHNTFVSCNGVNNGGWGLYVRESFLGSRSGLDNNKWTGEGNLVAHRKVTYTASLNDFGNFDTYGNRGGAIYMGGDSNSLTTGGMEHHFDSSNIDPFGSSSMLDQADTNPLRWAACVVFSAESRQNKMTVTGTPTDSRRVLMAKARLPQETASASHPDSDVYSAYSSNHYMHPRSDAFGSLVEVRPPSMASIHLTPYQEHERTSGDIPGEGASVVTELQGIFNGQNSFLYRPWAYEISPFDNQLTNEWNVVYSAKDPNYKGAGKSVALSADSIGVAGQSQIDVLHSQQVKHQLRGKTIPAMGSYTVSITLSNVGGVPIADLDIYRISAHISYHIDETDQVSDGGSFPDVPLESDFIIGSPYIRKYENANGDPKLTVYVKIFNPTSVDQVFNADDSSQHIFNLVVMDTSTNEGI